MHQSEVGMQKSIALDATSICSISLLALHIITCLGTNANNEDPPHDQVVVRRASILIYRRGNEFQGGGVTFATV